MRTRETTLEECFPLWSTGAFFTAMKSLYETRFPWLSNAAILDFEYFGNRSGDKVTSVVIDRLIREQDTPELTLTDVKTLCDICALRFGTQWEKLYAILSAQYNPIENYSMVEETIPENVRVVDKTAHSSDENRTSGGTTTSDVYGFNSSVSVPQGDADTTASEQITRDPLTNYDETVHTEEGKRKLTRSGNIGVTTSQQMIESEIDLWKWSFFQSVFHDVDTVLTCGRYA